MRDEPKTGRPVREERHSELGPEAPGRLGTRVQRVPEGHEEHRQEGALPAVHQMIYGYIIHFLASISCYEAYLLVFLVRFH